MTKKIMKDKLLSASLFLGIVAAGGFVVTMFSTIHFQATAAKYSSFHKSA